MDKLEQSEKRFLRPKSSGAIKLYSSEFSDKEDTTDNVSKKSLHHRVVPKSKSFASIESVPRLGSSTSSSGNSHHIKEWINLKSLVNLRDRHSAESSSMKQLYERVLSNEDNFVRGIEEFLKEQELLHLRKKEILYKNWEEKVYIPLRKEVEKVMYERYDQISSKRRKEYGKYIEHCNLKGHVFLDVYSPEEYNPFAIYNPTSKYPLSARTPRLIDPLLKAERQRLDEEKVILRCESGEVPSDGVVLSQRLPSHPLIPLGRTGSKYSTWSMVSLLNVDGPDRDRSMQRLGKKPTTTNIDFAAWANMPLSPGLVDREMRIQKKKHFLLPSTMPSQPRMLEEDAIEALPVLPSVRFATPPVSTTA